MIVGTLPLLPTDVDKSFRDFSKIRLVPLSPAPQYRGKTKSNEISLQSFPNWFTGHEQFGWRKEREGGQGCRAGLFEAKYDKFSLFLTVGLEIFQNLLSSWPFQVYAYLVFGCFFPKIYFILLWI